MEERIRVHDLYFKSYLPAERIQARVAEIGQQLSEKYQGRHPLFIGILNGAFVFAADLVRTLPFDCEIQFVRLSSYAGTQSTGQVKTLLGMDRDITQRPVIIVEDIVDTGRTLYQFKRDLLKLEPRSVEIVSLLFKPEALEFPLEVDYIGFSVPPRFLIGYGLDYNGLGRNLPGIYQLDTTP